MSTESAAKTIDPPALVEGRPVRELVVPVSDDGHFDRVVPLMSQLAMTWGVPVRLVHATANICSSDPELEEATDVLRDWYPDIVLGATHLYGDDPAAAIADTVGPGSLVVMSTDHIDRSRSMASVAGGVIDRVRAPVMLVGPAVTRTALRERGLRGEVIVGVDGSAAAEEGIGPAAALARSIGRPLRLVDVAGRTPGGDVDRPLPGQYLQGLSERIQPSTDASWEVVVSDDPIKGLEQLADRRHASFLVVTTSGRAAPERRTVAGVSAGLAEIAARPVLMVTAERGRKADPVSSPSDG